MGECRFKLNNPKTKQKFMVPFFVVDENLTPILGKRAAEQMGLITVHYEQFDSVTGVSSTDAEFVAFIDTSQAFDTTTQGIIPGKVPLATCEGAQPCILPARREPIATKPAIKKELDRMVARDIITPVNEPTDWVNQMSVQYRKNGKIRICLDPRPLNKVLKSEHYQQPVLEEVLPELSKARVFSKLDLREGYFHCELDENSSYLTTFATSFGRYRYKRLPYGINVSSDIFQRKLHQALEGLDGVNCIADDIVVSGETTAEHDARLRRLLKRCEQVGIRLNKEKCVFRQHSITFVGHEITSEGLRADPAKIEAVIKMPKPQTKDEIRTLQGMVGYLSKFLPRLSQVMEPLRQLLRDEVKFVWGKEQEKAFSEVKRLVTETPVLAYYKPDEELVLQCDASNKGLGAALLQGGKPIAYKSRAVTPTESRYALIEKEMLALVWGLEKFHQYTFGRPVIVHTDHKPLESIVKKPLVRAPRRLQAMLLRAQDYNYTVVWKKGSDQLIADHLSRSCLPEPGGHEEFEKINMSSFLPMRAERLERLQKETEADQVLSTLKSVIVEGWPDDKSKLPSVLMPYHSYADELTVQNGIIFKGERVIIPQSMRNEMKHDIHQSHLGVSGCTRRARESLFWPGMSSEIRQYISQCETCRRYETSEQKETLMSHELPERPWEKVGTDCFELDGKNYLITVDYFSNFWEIDLLDNLKSLTVVRKLKSHFARHGIPDQLISDNAPYFTSEGFQNFTQQWDIEHCTSSPHHQQGNGQAESAVKTAKRILTKCKESGGDQFMALLDHRNTPSQGLDESPAQRLFDRRTRTKLPTVAKLLEPKAKDVKKSKSRLKNRQENQAEYYNRKAKDLSVLEEGQVVRMKPYVLGKKVWEKGIINARLDERSYEVQAENGQCYRRNRVDLKPTHESMQFDESKSGSKLIMRKTLNGETEFKSASDTSQKTEKNPANVTPTKKAKRTEHKPARVVETEVSKSDSKHYGYTETSHGSSRPQKTRSGRSVRMPRHLQDYEVQK